MIDNTNFIKYKALKKKIDIDYRGIRLNRVLAIPCWTWANNFKFNKSILKCFLKRYDFQFLSLCVSDNIIYYDITGRKDHEKTFLNIASKVADQYCVINNSSGLKHIKCLSIINIIKSIVWIFGRLKTEDFKKKISIAGGVCMIMNSIDGLYNIQMPSIKRYVAYSIIHETQNLLGQFFRIKRARVIGLTHGAQIIYNKNIPLDCLNYENLNSECLVWSQMTKDEYVSYGIPKESLYIAGYPKSVKVLKVNKNNPQKTCLIMLCRKTYDNSNLKLLDLLQNYSMKFEFFVKLHPSCNYEYYKKECLKRHLKIISNEVSLTDCMDNKKYDFAIAINTSSYYEIQAAGIPCLRYDDGDTYDLPKGDENDRVSNRKEFEDAIKWIRDNILSGNMDNIIAKNLSFNLGVGIDRYREYLLS